MEWKKCQVIEGSSNRPPVHLVRRNVSKATKFSRSSLGYKGHATVNLLIAASTVALNEVTSVGGHARLSSTAAFVSLWRIYGSSVTRSLFSFILARFDRTSNSCLICSSDQPGYKRFPRDGLAWKLHFTCSSHPLSTVPRVIILTSFSFLTCIILFIMRRREKC